MPAWIGLVHGAVIVGLDDDELRRFATEDGVTKVARRDVPFALAAGERGATTVSATIWAAHRAGIEIGATGGIGGVHRGAHPDVSADLLELASTPVLLVCSGPKSIVDPALTAEKLEELGVAVVGYGTDRLPGFLASRTEVVLEHRVDTPDAAARRSRPRATAPGSTHASCCATRSPTPAPSRQTRSTRPPPPRRRRSKREAVTGKAVTPFLLSALAERTADARWRRTWTCSRTTRASPAVASSRSRSAQPGLDDDLREVPAVPQVSRLLRGPARPHRDRHRHLHDASAVAQRLDQDLARPELILLEHQSPQEVGARGAVAAREVGDARAR